MTEDKRQLGRLDLAIKVRVGFESADAVGAYFSQNLSSGGVFVRARDPRPVGSRLDLEYVLADGSVVVRAQGIVRWVRGEGGNDIGPPGMGVELVSVDEQGARFLRTLVADGGAARAPAVAGGPTHEEVLRAIAPPAPGGPEPLPPDMVAMALGGMEGPVASGAPGRERDPADEPATDDDGGAPAAGAAALGGVGSLPEHEPSEYGAALEDEADAGASSPADEPAPAPTPGPEDWGLEAEDRDGADALAPIAITDSRELERKLALLLDLSGPDLVAGVALGRDGHVTVGLPTSITPRVSADADGLSVQTRGVWVPCLVQLTALGWPSPTAALWARRFGLELGRDGRGGIAVSLGGRLVPAAEVLRACLADLVEPYANSDVLPDEACVVLPPRAPPGTTDLVLGILREGGHARVRTVSDVAALVVTARAPGAGHGPALVVQTSLLDTRVGLVSADGRPGPMRSALDTGLWRADDIVADRLALRLALRHGAGDGDERALRRELVAAVAAARAEGASSGGWQLAAAGVVLHVTELELGEAAAPASMRVLLACEEVLAEAGVRASELATVVLAADEPPWPGLADALGQGFGRPPVVVGTNAWCRLEGAARMIERERTRIAAVG